MTRARKRLWLLRSKQRLLFGTPRRNPVCPFLSSLIETSRLGHENRPCFLQVHHQRDNVIIQDSLGEDCTSAHAMFTTFVAASSFSNKTDPTVQMEGKSHTKKKTIFLRDPLTTLPFIHHTINSCLTSDLNNANTTPFASYSRCTRSNEDNITSRTDACRSRWAKFIKQQNIQKSTRNRKSTASTEESTSSSFNVNIRKAARRLVRRNLSSQVAAKPFKRPRIITKRSDWKTKI